MRDERRYLHYGKVISETARKLQVTMERRASLSVGQRASGRREVHIPILRRPLCREPCDSEYSHEWTLEIFSEGEADLAD